MSSTVAVPVDGFVMFHCRTSWMTPTPIPATKATGRLTMAPMSAATSASKRRSGLSTCVSALVWLGEARMAVTADKPPAMVHATVDVRRTQTPESRADSEFSAEARMARPHGENRMNNARPSATIGATMSVRTSPGVMISVPMWMVQLTGTGNARKSFFGRMKGRMVKRNSTCDKPIVATMTMTRGRLKSRRRRSSDNAPAAAANANAAASAAQ